MTPRQLILLAREHRIANGHQARSLDERAESPTHAGTAAWAFALKTKLAQQGGRPR
jgi:hypothetical protein